MKKISVRTCNYICVGLMALMLVLQFLPFWSAGDQSVSINGFVWFPSHYSELEKIFSGANSAYDINNLVGMPILQMVAAILGIILCLTKADLGLTALLPAVCGLAGILCYVKPEMQLGAGWMLHLLVSVVMLAMALAALVLMLLDMKELVKKK